MSENQTIFSTDELRAMAKDESVLVGNKYRDALTYSADAIEASFQKVEDLSSLLQGALMMILSRHEEDFVSDEDGAPQDFDDGGNLSESGTIYRYGDYEFDFRECMEFLADTPNPFPVNNGSKKNNRAFLQQFASREGAENALRKLGDAIAAPGMRPVVHGGTLTFEKIGGDK